MKLLCLSLKLLAPVGAIKKDPLFILDVLLDFISKGKGQLKRRTRQTLVGMEKGQAQLRDNCYSVC